MASLNALMLASQLPAALPCCSTAFWWLLSCCQHAFKEKESMFRIKAKLPPFPRPSLLGPERPSHCILNSASHFVLSLPTLIELTPTALGSIHAAAAGLPEVDRVAGAGLVACVACQALQHWTLWTNQLCQTGALGRPNLHRGRKKAEDNPQGASTRQIACQGADAQKSNMLCQCCVLQLGEGGNADVFLVQQVILPQPLSSQLGALLQLPKDC